MYELGMCYKCKYRGDVPGDTHSCCRYPGNDTNLFAMFESVNFLQAAKLDIRADKHGVMSGWFMCLSTSILYGCATVMVLLQKNLVKTMGNISERVAKQILPAELQKNYGNEFGIEVWRVLSIVEKNDTAIKELLDALDRLEQPNRKALIQHLWTRYYDFVADKVLAQ